MRGSTACPTGWPWSRRVDFFPPLVNDPFIFGQIAAANALSDVYAMNARPLDGHQHRGLPRQ